MERDAPPPAPTTPAEADPPRSPEFVRVVGLVGVGMTAAATVLAIVADSFHPPPAVLTPIQLFLVFVGMVVAGSAVSMRPDLWWAWGLGGLAALLGSIGLPASWDSFPPLFRTMAAIGAAGVVIRLSSPGWRVLFASGMILFHFTGIFSATTSPPPQPWIVEQAWTRVFNPYLNFVYLRNAYHYYSPDPGPASIMVFLLKTETGTDPDGKKLYTTKWVVVPKRPNDLKDPLGLAYYRRLSLTEHAARGSPAILGTSDHFEKTEMFYRRFNTDKPNMIPPHPVELPAAQYQLPNSEIMRYILPSYASHVILEQTPDKETAGKTTVKVYRLEHRPMSPEEFVPAGEYKRRMPPGMKPSPYYPPTYRPFFQGEFNARGDLIDSQDEMLYWMVPIIPRQPLPGDPVQKTYIDYMSVHALGLSTKEVLEAKESDGKVFDWDQFRSNR